METAWQRNPGQLMVGFNRRWSDSVQRARAHFGGGGGPLVVTYRVNAGMLPQSHWYHDRRQGGRLLGEVCHFIDTCNAIVGVHPGACGPPVRATGRRPPTRMSPWSCRTVTGPLR